MVFEGGNVSCLTYQCFHAECGMCVLMKKRNECKILRILPFVTLSIRVFCVMMINALNVHGSKNKMKILISFL